MSDDSDGKRSATDLTRPDGLDVLVQEEPHVRAPQMGGPPGVVAVARTTTTTTTHSGPLPSPTTLKAYEEVFPGSANFIMTMAEKEQDHRHAIDHKLTDGVIRESRLGQWLTFGVSICGLGAGAVLAATASVTAGVIIALVVPVLVTTRGVAKLVTKKGSVEVSNQKEGASPNTDAPKQGELDLR
jgi:uncharacterized membrane protein